MLCEIPCSTWIPPDEGLSIQHAGDPKTVLRISKNRIASFEGQPIGLVVRREKSYSTMITLVATGLGVGGLGAVLAGFGASEDCNDSAGVLCGAGAVFIGTGAIMTIAGIAIGGRLKSSYELEEVPPWLMGHPLIPPPGYVAPPEMMNAPRPPPPPP